MKQILIIILIFMFFPLVLFALWYVLETPGMLDAEEEDDDCSVLDNTAKKGTRA